MGSFGKYIVIEGGDGCGKTTQARLLEGYLKKSHDVIVTREPGGSEFSERIREILKDPALNKFLDPLTEFLLFSAARSALYRTEVKPALEQGRIVVSDRNDLSSHVYQGIVGGVSIELISAVSANILNKNNIPIKPDCGIIINPITINSDQIKKLIEEDSKKSDRFHHKGLEYHLKVYKAYEEVAKQRGFHIVRYREGDIEVMQQEIRKYVDSILEQ